MAKRVEVTIDVRIPDDWTVVEFRRYVRDAVTSWCGQMDPEGSLHPGYFDTRATNPAIKVRLFRDLHGRTESAP